MILHALNKYYDRLASKRRVPAFGFSMENVSFVLEIDNDGKLVQEYDIRQRQGSKVRPVLMEIPYTNAVNVRSSKVEPNFLVDKAAYLLGADQKTKPSRLVECHKAFVDLLKSVLAEVADDGARAVLCFYEHWKPSEASKMLEYWDEISSDNAGFIAWRLSGERQYIHLRPKIKRAWQKYLSSQKSEFSAQCLVSGKLNANIQRLHAQFKRIAGGQSSGMSLVSFNIKSSESYGKEQSFNAPVGVEAEFRSSTALKYLIHNEAQNIYIGDVYTVFWSERDSPVEGMLASIFDPEQAELSDNAELRQFLKAISQGKKPDKIDRDIKFYILGLSPNAGRLSVRFCHVCSVGELEQRIGQHYRDLQLQRSFDSDPEYPGVRRILWETYNKKSRTETASPLLAGALMRCILEGTAYPRVLQNAVINRIRADQDINYVRAAILKAILVRKHRIYRQGMEVKMALDEKNRNPAYLLGRLFAVLEKAQQEAISNANVTIKERFWGAASTTPRIVFPQLLNLKNHHISKIKMENQGRAIFFEKLLGEIVDNIESSGFPPHLTLDEQGLFTIGYYHQRQNLFKKQETVS